MEKRKGDGVGEVGGEGDLQSADKALGNEDGVDEGGHNNHSQRRKRSRNEGEHHHHRTDKEKQKERYAERKRESSPAVNYLSDPRKRLGRGYELWQAGQTILTPEIGQSLTILRRIDDGHAGVVFKVRDEDGNVLALKVPRKESEKQFKKLHQEVAKNVRMQSLGLPVAEITEEGGDYLVKRWIDGLRGDHWFIQWNEKGRPLDDLAWRRLCDMFDMLAAKGVYVQNLKDLNVIWDSLKWVVIDVGYFKVSLTPQQALGRYYETFDGRWNKPRYNRGRFMFLCPSIAALRGHSHPQHYIKRDIQRTYYKKKSKTSTGGDSSTEISVPSGRENGGGSSTMMLVVGIGSDGRMLGVGTSNGTPSEAQNDIKRKQAEAALAVLERAKNRKKKKKTTTTMTTTLTAAPAEEGEAKDEGTAIATVTTPTKEEKNEAKNKKRSAKEEDVKEKREKVKELKAKKEKDQKEKKERKEKELKEKKEKVQKEKDQKEKEKKEKEQQKKTKK